MSSFGGHMQADHASAGRTTAAHLALLILMLILLWPPGILIHEMGHGLIALAFGAEITHITIWPGIELYPDVGESHEHYRNFGSMGYEGGQLAGWRRGLLMLMGSGSTLLIAALAHLLLWTRQPRRLWPCSLWMALGLFYLDLVTYTLNPQLGLPRAIFFGRRSGLIAEPLEGARLMGLPAALVNAATLLILVGMSASILLYFWRSEALDRAERPEDS